MRVHQAMPGVGCSMEGLVGVSTFGFAVGAGARWGVVRTSTSRYVYVWWVLFGVGGRVCGTCKPGLPGYLPHEASSV